MKTLLVRTAYLIDVEDDLIEGYGVDERFDLLMSNALAKDVAIDATRTAIWNSYTYMILYPEEDNCGKCVNCGGWTTDREKPGYINELGKGATVDGKLLCDECLPRGHEFSFFQADDDFGL